MLIREKIYYFITIYRTTNRSNDKFNLFIRTLVLNLDKQANLYSFVAVGLANFIPKSFSWCPNMKTKFEGAKIVTQA